MLTTRISENIMYVYHNLYLKTIKKGNDVLLTDSEDNDDGKILVDFSKEGEGNLIIPNEVDIIDIEHLKAAEFKYKIKSVFVPEKVREIRGIVGLFRYAKEIKVDPKNQHYDSRNKCNAIIETSTNKLIAGCEAAVIPNSVVEIGERAFSGIGISEINMPNGLQKIDKDAFYGCSKLQSLTIPSSVTEIETNALHSVSNINEIVVDQQNPKYDSRNDCNAIIETKTNTLIFGCGNTIVLEGVTRLEDRAFANCKSLEEIELPDSVTSIGPWCFSKSSLKSIVIPDSVTEIGEAAFWNCRSLEKITIPAVKFGSNAFYECGNISKVYFSNSMKCLDMRQFVDEGDFCSSNREPFRHLKELRFSASIEKIDNLDYYFEDIDTLVFEGRIPETNDSFNECKIKNLIIKQSKKQAGEIPPDIREALVRDVRGEINYTYGTPDFCNEDSAIPGYIKATLAKNEELVDINTKYIISVEPCEYLHYENIGSLIKCAADSENHVAYEIKVHEPCEMITKKISRSLEQLGSMVGGIGGLINLIEKL